ncbi:MAG: hypothetical protein KDD40_02870 [Bdellovibrionales bacterium]|nr:hypothetical protein [Bdellovibrionales bacterium]
MPDHLTERDLDQSISIDGLPFPKLVESIQELKAAGNLGNAADVFNLLKQKEPNHPIFQNVLYVTRSGGYRGDVAQGGLIDKGLQQALGIKDNFYLSDPASLVEPRVISFDAGETNSVLEPSISIGLPKDQNFIEMHIYDPQTDQRDYYFGYLNNNQAKFVKNPAVCFSCHSKGKPIWGGHMWSIHGLYSWNTERAGLTEGLEHHYKSNDFRRAYGEFLEASGDKGVWAPFKKYSYPDTYASLAMRLHLLYGMQENKIRLKRILELPEALNPRFQATLLMALLNLPTALGEEHPRAQILSPRVLLRVLPTHKWGENFGMMLHRHAYLKEQVANAVQSNNTRLSQFQDKSYQVFEYSEGEKDLASIEYIAWIRYVFEAWGHEKMMDHWATTRSNSYAFTAQYDDNNVTISELNMLGIRYLNWIAETTNDPILNGLLEKSLQFNHLIMGSTMEVNYYQPHFHINPVYLIEIINYLLNKASWHHQGVSRCFQVLSSNFGTLYSRDIVIEK